MFFLEFLIAFFSYIIYIYCNLFFFYSKFSIKQHIQLAALSNTTTPTSTCFLSSIPENSHEVLSWVNLQYSEGYDFLFLHLLPQFHWSTFSSNFLRKNL